jgi:hypothetical protein
VNVSARRLLCSVFVMVVGALALASAPALAAALETPELTVEDSTAAVGSPSIEARLHGVLNPKAAQGEGGIYQFLYSASKVGVCAGGSVAPASPGMSFGFEHEEYFETVAGLAPGTEYAVCLRVENDAKTETKTSAAVSFTTAVPPEKPETVSPAASVTATTATFEGVLNPVKAGEAGTYEFLYRVSATECEGERASPEPAGVMSGAVKQAVSVPVSALQPNAMYTFCLRARNAAGETAVGNAVHFTTPPAAPTVESESASGIKASEAHLEGVVNPNNQTSECRFQYEVEAPSLAAPTTRFCEPASFVAGFGGQGVGLNLRRLEADKTYYYRVLAENAQSIKEGKPAEGAIKHFTTAFPPETPEKAKASGETATTAELHGVLNPTVSHESEPGTYEFLYRQSATECTGEGERRVPEPAKTATGKAPEPVEGQATGLLPGATYTFCLLAKNDAGEEALGPPETFTTLASAPLIEESSVSDVASSSATLSAKIDPHGSETTYRFEYLTEAEYQANLAGGREPFAGALLIPSPEGIVGSGPSGVTVSAHPQGLEPNTTYHYRVLATVASKSETIPGSDETFTTQRSGGEPELPDGRQWELVTPPDKHGAKILSDGNIGLLQAADDGSGITYGTSVPTEAEPPGYGQEGEGFLEQAVSTRSAQGWSTRDIGTPHKAATHVKGFAEYLFSSADLSSALAFPDSPQEEEEGGLTLLSSEASEPTPYVRRESLCDTPASASECYQPILTGKQGFADVPPGTVFGRFHEVEFLGASPDLNHVLIYYSGSGLAPLTEWSANEPPGEALQPVSVLPASEGGETVLGGEAGANEDDAIGLGENRHSISDDGSRVLWYGAGNSLYMRDLPKHETVLLNRDANFQIASSNGSKAFYTSTGELYECAFFEEADGKLACKQTDLTPEIGGQAAGVQKSVLGASEDGSYVYFAAGGVLGDGAQEGALPGSCGSEPSGTCNLYEDHEGKITFIAALSDEDETDWDKGGLGNISSMWARVSPDGRYLAFMSSRSLTGYDNRDAVSGKPDQEVYLYDAVSKRLVCASCNPTGSRPLGVEAGEITKVDNGTAQNLVDLETDPNGAESTFTEESWVAANIPGDNQLWGYGFGLYLPRALSDGGRLFFNSHDELVPQAVNGQEDVYEYEPEGFANGEGTVQCTASSATFSARSGGCVSLISSGSSPEESAFLDASEGGGDVFFLTSAKLVGQDVDTSYDIYDAHECTKAAPCVSAPVSSPPCDTADSCEAPPSPQPSIYGAPASATFTGAGNIAPEAPKTKAAPKTAKCGKGRVRVHDKCVKAKEKQRKTRGKAKKSSRGNGR